ncbi:MAG: hypothetical protein F4Z82_15435 [Caldilineaceae bacterium SB0668_bin_21]|nr:hypothetical protein [Caldilineaceae bacterium SB0668_bin_21]MYC20728.1 hypothetical protein [Caldilineaceae bacterium SB0662_bin_25]
MRILAHEERRAAWEEKQNGDDTKQSVFRSRKMEEPGIPSSYHTFLRLIRRLQEEDPSAPLKMLKQRIIYLLDLPPEKNDPYWDEQEFSYLRSSRTRRQLFDDRFNLAMYKIRKEEGKSR